MTTDKIVLYKLMSGEYLIGKLTDEGDTTVNLSYPATLIPRQQGVSFQPFKLFCDKSDMDCVELPLQAVMIELVPDPNLVEGYLEFETQFRAELTGITVVNKPRLNLIKP